MRRETNVSALIEDLYALELQESQKLQELSEINERKRNILNALKAEQGSTAPAQGTPTRGTVGRHTERVCRDCNGTGLLVGDKVGFAPKGVHFYHQSAELASGRIIRFTKKHVDIEYYIDGERQTCLRTERKTVKINEVNYESDSDEQE